jgi:hypothetical protein
MNVSEHIAPEDLSLLAMQFLSDEDSAEMLAHLHECEDCRHEMGQVQGDLVTYAMTAEMHSPPALARERLLRRVAKERKLVSIDRAAQKAAAAEGNFEPTLAGRSIRGFDLDTAAPPSRRSAVGWFGWMGWAAAAGIAAFAGTEYHHHQLEQNQLMAAHAQVDQLTAANTVDARTAAVASTVTDASAMQVALHLPASGTEPVPQGHASYAPQSGSLVFVASNMPKLQQYKTYELWLLPASGHDAIAAGLFKPDEHGNATLVASDLPKGITAQGFGVTVEDDGGSKLGPTKPIVLVGLGA